MQVLILMGVSGVGKTTIGNRLSQEIGIPFYDADDFHPEENIRKMKNGIPLEDKDRLSWLEVLALQIREWEKTTGAILACSALKEEYRKHLQSYANKKITWIFLHADYEIILKRINSRKNHYFKPHLLMSQYESLQEPEYGIHINVEPRVDEIIKNIMEKIKVQEDLSEIGLVGLGVMGKSLALNLAGKGIKISVYNRQVPDLEVDIAENFAKEHQDELEFSWFDELKSFVESLKAPRNILLMVNAGKAVDAVIQDLFPYLEPGDLIIDGGNSHYKDTIRREKELKQKGLLFMGVGISGGEEGAKKGPSIMPGGAKPAYEMAGKFLERIAAKDKDGGPCCTFVGPDGAGHFVKMLHNGIEYGEMQLIAECYHYLRYFTDWDPEKISALFEKWNQTQKSYLLGISSEILRRKENNDYLIDKILDAAKQKGTGGWSTNAALELGVPFDTITASVMARNLSGKKAERLTAAKLYQGHHQRKTADPVSVETLFQAYRMASIINHAIGFELLSEASESYGWVLDLSEIARIWTNGCIIKSGLMEDLAKLFKEGGDKNLLLHSEIVSKITESRSALMETVARAVVSGAPVPVLAAAANYLNGFTSAQSSANMIQAQRDFFGAHSYERTDKPRGEFFHTHWLKPEN